MEEQPREDQVEPLRGQVIPPYSELDARASNMYLAFLLDSGGQQQPRDPGWKIVLGLGISWITIAVLMILGLAILAACGAFG